MSKEERRQAEAKIAARVRTTGRAAVIVLAIAALAGWAAVISGIGP